MKQVFAMATHCSNTGHGGSYLHAVQQVKNELQNFRVKARLFRWQRREQTMRYTQFVILFEADASQRGIGLLHSDQMLVHISESELAAIMRDPQSGALQCQ